MKKVSVGLSGGVDSSVAAALLKKQGYDVTGVYMKNWSRDVAGHHCPWKEDLQSARSVAAHLQIPLKIYNFEKQYFNLVTKYMIETYKSGLTPNPDVMCNQKIKFDTFYKQCLADGADLVATGHYARLSNQSQRISSSDLPDNTRRRSSTTRSLASDLPRTSSELNAQMIQVRLMTAVDQNKDQTYFLYRMDPSVASKVLFPIGEYTKPQVRKLAEKFNLPTATRHDSQGLCFVGNVSMKDFLGVFIKPKKGEILDVNGKLLGQHEGAFAFTIGQRHGLGVGGGKPYFVYKINTKANKVYVTSNEKSPLLNKTEFVIDNCIWWDKPAGRGQKKEGEKMEVKVRYRSKSVACEVAKISNDKYLVKLKKPERAITSGQSAVIYHKNFVVGGGIIV